MSGNVFEWVSSIYKRYPYDANDGREDPNDTTSPRVYRGGNQSYLDYARRRDDPLPPRTRPSATGFSVSAVRAMLKDSLMMNRWIGGLWILLLLGATFAATQAQPAPEESWMIPLRRRHVARDGCSR